MGYSELKTFQVEESFLSKLSMSCEQTVAGV